MGFAGTSRIALPRRRSAHLSIDPVSPWSIAITSPSWASSTPISEAAARRSDAPSVSRWLSSSASPRAAARCAPAGSFRRQPHQRLHVPELDPVGDRPATPKRRTGSHLTSGHGQRAERERRTRDRQANPLRVLAPACTRQCFRGTPPRAQIRGRAVSQAIAATSARPAARAALTSRLCAAKERW